MMQILELYEYDENGNLTKDSNRNILSIQYNSLNLPTVIAFADGKTIKYTYSADGRKLRAVYTTTTPATTKQIDYCGNLIFENGQLKQVLVDGGYIPVDDWSGAYCYYVKDHLGNNRMVVHQSGSVNQVNNYYPYGGLMANSTGWNTQRYKYNGKELDRMHGLDWYDYGARWMDASIGRWHSVDPLCEKFYNVSPYVYCDDNPISRMDPDGKSPVIGALIGGGLDFAAQVVGGMVSGQSFSEAAAHVNWVSVGTAALAGAAGVGIASKLKQVSNIEKMSKVASISTEVAIDGGAGGIASAGKQAMDNKGKISIKKVASDAFASALGGQAGNKSLRLSRSSSEYKTLQRQADHANRVAKGSTRSSRTQGALKANAKVAKFGQTKAATISAGTSETVSRTSDKLQNR